MAFLLFGRGVQSDHVAVYQAQLDIAHRTLGGQRGVILYTQMDHILETLRGSAAHDIFPLASFAATLGGLVMALVGSVVWARRASLRQPLWLAVSTGIGCILVGLVVDINVHEPSGILLFPLLFAVIDVVLLMAVTYW